MMLNNLVQTPSRANYNRITLYNVTNFIFVKQIIHRKRIADGKIHDRANSKKNKDKTKSPSVILLFNFFM